MSFKLEIDESVSKDPERIVLYGDPGVGKTTFLANMPDPFVLDLETGSKRVKIARNKNEITSWLDLIQAVRWFAENDHRFKTLGIDTISKAEMLCHDHIIRTVGGKGGKSCKSISEVAGGFGQGYTIAAEEFRNLLGELERVWKRGIRIVLIGHTKIGTVKNTDGSDWQRKTINVHDAITSLLMQNSDVCMHARMSVTVVKDGFADEKRARAIKGEGRYLQCLETPTCVAKNRLGLPEVIPFSYEEFVAQATNSETLLLDSIREKARRLDALKPGTDIVTKHVERKIAENQERHKLVQLLGSLATTLDKAEQAKFEANAQ